MEVLNLDDNRTSATLGGQVAGLPRQRGVVGVEWLQRLRWNEEEIEGTSKEVGSGVNV